LSSSQPAGVHGVYRLPADFRPEIGTQILLNEPYEFTAHPAALGLPYGQTGRRGTVYQIRRISDGTVHAIKIFTKLFQDPRNEHTAARLSSFAGMPGLQVCSRSVHAKLQFPELVHQFPQLEYAVLMPWVKGETWYDFIFGKESLTHDQSWRLASHFLSCLCQLEKHRMAHCDLSGANILIQTDTCTVAMVDVEEIYSPDLYLLDEKKRPAGTPGYAHKTAYRGLWNSFADRFAGAVLLAEMLGWCDENVREHACEAQYFEDDEVQAPQSERLTILLGTLRREWGENVAALFMRAWNSNTLDECPKFEAWAAALSKTQETQSASDATQQIAGGAIAEEQKIQPQPIQDGIRFGSFADPLPVVPDRSAQLGHRMTTVSALPVSQPKPVMSGFIKTVQALSLGWVFGSIAGIAIIGAVLFIFALVNPVKGNGVIYGQVKASDNIPLNVPVTVSLELAGFPPYSVAPAPVNEQGVFRFTGLPLRSGQVTVKADGYKAVSQTIDLTQDNPQQQQNFNLSLDDNSCIVTGKVTDTLLTPLQGASVKTNEAATKTDATGTYVFVFTQKINSGTLVASSNGYTSKTVSFACIPGVPPTPRDIRLNKSQ